MKKILEVFKRIKLKTIILLIVLLAFNSYAWFIYASKVSGSFTAHITSWNVEFQSGEEETVTNINFIVDRIYPGMETYSQTLTVYNKGEMQATLSYEIKSITILENEYQIDEETTSEDLQNMIQNDFPFHINISVDNTNLSAGNGEAQFNISLEWAFESGEDDIDTYWGEKAYEFYSIHASQPSITMEIEISAIQQ